MSTLVIKDLHVEIDGKEILKGVNLTINTNEIHAIMGPNGTGKSTLASKGYTTYVNRRARLARDAKVDWALGLMNDSDTISENITHLIGDGSHADTKTVVVGRGEQKLNFTTEVRHWGKN
ncbi:hypothetical protein LSPH24S_03278 [Lysinibacillus sphaericus]